MMNNFMKGDTEIVISKLDAATIETYADSELKQQALEQGYCYCISTVNPSSLVYVLTAEELVDHLLSL